MAAAVVLTAASGWVGEWWAGVREAGPGLLGVTEEQRAPDLLGSRGDLVTSLHPIPSSSLTLSTFWNLQTLRKGKPHPWTGHEGLAKPVPAPPLGGSWVFPW